MDKVDSQSYFEMSQLLTVKKMREREGGREGGIIHVFSVHVWMDG